MAHPKRFELLTPRFVVWCSIQLSYGCAGPERPAFAGGSPVRLPLANRTARPGEQVMAMTVKSKLGIGKILARLPVLQFGSIPVTAA